MIPCHTPDNGAERPVTWYNPDSGNGQQVLWNVDETGWMSFIRRPEKSNFLAWMWVFASPKVILYIFDPSRSSKVPLAHLGEKVRGFLVADRFSAYSKLAKMVPELVVSVCWAHFRRDFINAGKSFQQLQPWVDRWKKRIAEIYRLNRRRLESKESEAQRELEEAINKMAGDIAAELTNPNLHYEQRRVLTSAQKHWPGLTVFVRHPEVPMDNNRAERALRRIALGRKNYFGSFADWSSLFAAVCLTVLQTAILHGLNPVAYLRYYLDACAAAGGVPEHLERFHPWNIPEDVLESHKMRGAKRA
jgi:transposase